MFGYVPFVSLCMCICVYNFSVCESVCICKYVFACVSACVPVCESVCLP